MKKLLTGAATAALIVAGAPAFAQSYVNPNNAKNHDSTLGAATYSQPQTAAPMQAQVAPATTTTTTTTAVATPEPAAVEPAMDEDVHHGPDFSGPYAGVEGMYQDGRVEGWGGGLVAGFGWTPDYYNHAYLGGEIGYDWTGAEDNGVAEHSKMNISLRPGVVVGPALGYLIADYSRASFKNNITTEHNWLNGFGGGAGVEAAIPRTPLKGRVEYVYTEFQGSGATDGHAHDNDIKAALIYQLPVKKGGMW